MSYNDYQDGKCWKVMNSSVAMSYPKDWHRSLTSCDHGISPSLDGMRIRHYGFLANRCRKAKLERIRQLLAQAPEAEVVDKIYAEPNSDQSWLCSKCHQGHLHIQQALSPIRLNGGGCTLID